MVVFCLHVCSGTGIHVGFLKVGSELCSILTWGRGAVRTGSIHHVHWEARFTAKHEIEWCVSSGRVDARVYASTTF